MKKKTKEVLLTLVLVCAVIACGVFLGTYYSPQKEVDSKAPSTPIAYQEKNAVIEKLETKDYYYYTVNDYERNLTYSWKFQKDPNKQISVEESLNIDVDLRLSIDAWTQNTQEITSRVNQNKLIITFDHHGQLPLEATVRINVSNRFKDNERLYLYYYNPESNQIEYIAHNVKVKDGYVEFTIEHCSDYFLTAAVVNDAVGNPQSINYIIIGLVVVVFILIAVTLVQSKNK